MSEAFDGILTLHRTDFRESTRPVVGPPPPPNEQAIVRWHRSDAKRSTSLFDRAGRNAALVVADKRAADEIAQIRTELAQQEETYQAEFDRWWESLIACQPDVVLDALAHAFEDNEAPAAAVGVEETEASLVVVVAPVSTIPERKPGTTPAGNLTLKKLTKRETADFYKFLVFGHMLVPLREALAVVPSLTSARIVAIRPSDPDAYGRISPEVIAAARCERTSLLGVKWAESDAVQIFNDCCDNKLLNQRGVTKQLTAINLSEEPELRALLDAVDMEDLLD